MNPSIELRIRTLVRAMTEAVIPALDPGDALAQEQARLVVGHLQVIAQQLGREASCEAVERQDLERLARELGSDVSTLDERIRAVLRDGNSAEREHVTRATLAHARSAALLGGAWFAALGFSRDPAALPALDTLFEREPE